MMMEKQMDSSLIGENKHNKAVLCCCWNNNGSYIFSGGCDNTLRSWNIGNKSTKNILGTH